MPATKKDTAAAAAAPVASKQSAAPASRKARGVRNDPRIDEIEACEDFGGITYMVHLKDGFRLDDAHTFGEDSMEAIRETMKSVKPCDCEFCRAAFSKASQTSQLDTK